ncbi:MAG TPA: hypothetical protein VM661_15925 [Candidatus Sulfotelmatobacter sp.]|jgi:hypothetical protein|nr:hypothetical protein [Candidatus Sulfotelmatobacter sp.]
MSGDASSELRRFAGRVVEAFVQAVDRQYAGSAVGPDLLRKAGAVFSVSDLLMAMADQTARNLASEEIDDPYQRLLISPLGELLQSGELSRDILPNYFHFIHLVMGDGQAPLAEACAAIVAKMKSEPFPPFGWDDFLADPRARVVLWTVLLRIAENFKRFDLRRDWFIKLMQYDRQSVSLASNAFIPKPKVEEDVPKPPFGGDQFKVLFGALFAPLKKLGGDDQAAFRKSFGQSVEAAFAPLWNNLKSMGVEL